MNLTGICKATDRWDQERLYKSIEAPKLRHISMTDDLPSTTHCPTSITSFSLTLDKFEFGIFSPPERLTSYLAAASCLTELSLNFVHFRHGRWSSMVTVPPVAKLERLEKLRLTVTETPWSSVAWVHDILIFPHLRELEVELRVLASELVLTQITRRHHHYYSEVSDYLGDIIPGPKTCQLVYLRYFGQRRGADTAHPSQCAGPPSSAAIIQTPPSRAAGCRNQYTALSRVGVPVLTQGDHIQKLAVCRDRLLLDSSCADGISWDLG